MAACLTRGIGIEVMDNAAAARTFNVLATEGRRVLAAFLLPGPALKAPSRTGGSARLPLFAHAGAAMTDTPLKYRRVLLKLSGEALMGREDYGIDPDGDPRRWPRKSSRRRRPARKSAW